MKENVHMKDCELMYTVVHSKAHYCGGTERGCEFLEQSPWVPYSFIGSLSTKKGNAFCDTSV